MSLQTGFTNSQSNPSIFRLPSLLQGFTCLHSHGCSIPITHAHFCSNGKRSSNTMCAKDLGRYVLMTIRVIQLNCHFIQMKINNISNTRYYIKPQCYEFGVINALIERQGPQFQPPQQLREQLPVLQYCYQLQLVNH